MAKADKKIFSVGNQRYTLVRGSRWYLEYYSTDRGTPERMRAYGGLNRIKDLEKREAAYFELAQSITYPTLAPCYLSEALNAAKPLLRLKTWQSQKARLKYFKEWLAGRSPACIGVKEGNSFIAYLIGKGKQSATVSSYRNTLSAIYKRAGLTNPWRAVSVPSVVSRSLMYLRTDQVAVLMQHFRKTDQELALAAQLLYYCFIRPGEMRLLTVDCINLDMGTITVPASISKNKRSGTVIIPAALITELRSSGRCDAPGHYYLLGKGGVPGMIPVGKNHFNRFHAMALKDCEITGRYAFYSWKHTGAVMAVKAGINLKDLQMQLRHHSLDMVNEYLKNLGVLDSDDLRNKFPEI